MKRLKKAIPLILVACMLFMLAACGNGGPGAAVPTGGSAAPPAAGGEPAPASITDPAEVRRSIEETEANSDWGDLAYEAGILDRVTEVIHLDRDFVFRIGTTQGPRSDMVFVAELFQAYVEASTAGRVRVEIFPLGQLGTHMQALQGVLAGDITGWICPLEMLFSFAPGVGVVTIPFLFEYGSYQATRIFHQDSTMDEYLKSRGFWPVTWGYLNSSVLMSNRRFETLSDFGGLRIWSPPAEMTQMMFTAFGATPVLGDSTEIPLMFETGTIDASSGGISFFDGFSVQEGSNANYLHRFPMFPSPLIMTFSVEFMESLPENLHEVIVRAGRIIPEYQFHFNTEFLASNEESMRGHVELVEVSADLWATAREATAHIQDFFISQSDENARLFETFSRLLEADRAAGGGGGNW